MEKYTKMYIHILACILTKISNRRSRKWCYQRCRVLMILHSNLTKEKNHFEISKDVCRYHQLKKLAGKILFTHDFRCEYFSKLICDRTARQLDIWWRKTIVKSHIPSSVRNKKVDMKTTRGEEESEIRNLIINAISSSQLLRHRIIAAIRYRTWFPQEYLLRTQS